MYPSRTSLIPVTFSLLTLGISISGCTPAEKALPVVGGKVNLDGEPLRVGTVLFFPESDTGSETKIHGRIMPNGAYNMFTDTRMGVPEGRYKAVVRLRENEAKRAPMPIPSKYTEPDTTSIVITVPGNYDLDLKKD